MSTNQPIKKVKQICRGQFAIVEVPIPATSLMTAYVFCDRWETGLREARRKYGFRMAELMMYGNGRGDGHDELIILPYGKDYAETAWALITIWEEGTTDQKSMVTKFLHSMTIAT